jgi:sugar lactone lactonase YvrE
VARPSIDPKKWEPPPLGPDAPSPLPTLRVIPVPGTGPEDVLVDTDGSVLTGVDDGRILRVDPATGRSALVAETRGRPLGLEWLPDGRLLVCDAKRGLLVIDLAAPEKLEVWCDTAAGRRLVFCNNAGVEPDGTVWFTDSSARFGIDHWKADIIEHSGTGRLLRRDPDGTVEVVVEGLQFANGVAVAPDRSAVFVAETGSYALGRYGLSGPDSGRFVPVGAALPGFPDNISTGSDGLIWVTIASPRNVALEQLAGRPGWVRKVVWVLPEALQPKPEHLTRVLAVDPTTLQTVHDLSGEHPEFGMCTGVREESGIVWLGSLTSTTVASFPTP